MSNSKYVIGSGYYHRPGDDWARFFFEPWLRNTEQTDAEMIVVLCNGRCAPPFLRTSKKLSVITLDGNLGHVHDLIGKSDTPKPYAYCGWSATVMTLALIAYNNECDFIYKEQDCLAFGPWVKQMYDELGEAGKIIFGKSRQMPVAQSLFLIKHEAIPAFIQTYLALPNDRDISCLPETKFSNMQRYNPVHVKQFSFPFDRDRPLDYGLPVWYAQKFTADELGAMNSMGLISANMLPSDVKVFTNDTTGL